MLIACADPLTHDWGTVILASLIYSVDKAANTVGHYDAYIKNNHHNNSKNTSLHIMSDQLASAGNVLDKIKPEIIIILGDRFDILPIAIACHLKGIAIAHFHGGELTYGAIDDAIRHSITKYSDIHFVANSNFKKRVIQLGENPKTVFNCGISSLSNFKNFKFLKKKKIEKDLKIKFIFS